VALWFPREEFTDEEREILSRYVTDVDGPVFALRNLPEVVKGALFARYSRTPKSLKRLFLDEFAEQAAEGRIADVGVAKAEGLYERIFVEYGDDSVAQLGGVHLACEYASQILTKVIEWSRLAAYLEQSTRYIPYDDKPGGRFRWTMPPEVQTAGLGARFAEVCDDAFETYARWLEPMREHFRARFPQQEGDSNFVYRSTINAKACDTLRGLLPAATRTHVGMFATGQTYEQLLLRLRAHPLEEVREYGDLILTQLRKVIPAFLVRVDQEDRGVAWSRYLAETRARAAEVTARILGDEVPPPRPEVVLTDFEPDGETKIVAAALYATSSLPDDRLLEIARGLSDDERRDVLRAYVGDRRNRRHKPGRAFERTGYRFDVLCDYGAFRDLQRHRLLTLEWQTLGPGGGFELPPDVEAAGATEDWDRVMERSAELHAELIRAGLSPEVAQYAVSMGYRVRFVMQMNAREAMHLIELRSSPQGHPVYRRVAHEMHRLIAEEAGHRAVAEAMSHVDHSDVDLERLEAERRAEAKRTALQGS
jgi:thymidylate synthase ThyX